MTPEDFQLPSTPAIEAAQNIAVQYHSPALVNHVRRSWAWAQAMAIAEGMSDIDHELLGVAALLHDLGLVPEFDNHTLSYEHAAGHVAMVLATGAGWSGERTSRLLEVIVRHNWPFVDRNLDAEGHLLEMATGFDVTGAHQQLLSSDYVEQVFREYPRGSLAKEFCDGVADQARRKPDTAAARLMRAGLPRRMASHPAERG